MADVEGEIGGLFAGRFRVLREVGSGGMGKVYLAEDTLLGGNPIALKVLRADVAEDEEQRQRFLREAQIARKLNHPSIVRTYELTLEGNTPFITMEYIDGESLRDRIRRAPLGVGDAMRILIGVCRALIVIHEAGIFHRDLKPGNILLDKDGKVHIADFGVARLASSTLTSPDAVIGSSAYLAPELWKGSPASAASDIYALGIVAYEMVVGEVPFDGASPVEVMSKHLRGEIISPHQSRPDVPAWYTSIVRRLMSLSSEMRPASAAECISLMQDVMAHGAAVAASACMVRPVMPDAPAPVIETATMSRRPSSNSSVRRFSGMPPGSANAAMPDSKPRTARGEWKNQFDREFDSPSREPRTQMNFDSSRFEVVRQRVMSGLLALLLAAIPVVIGHQLMLEYLRPMLMAASGWFAVVGWAAAAVGYVLLAALIWSSVSWIFRSVYRSRELFLAYIIGGLLSSLVVLLVFDATLVVIRSGGNVTAFSAYRVKGIIEQNLERFVRLTFLIPRARESNLGPILEAGTASQVRDEGSRALARTTNGRVGEIAQTKLAKGALATNFSGSRPSPSVYGVPISYLFVYLGFSLLVVFSLLRFVIGTATEEGQRILPLLLAVCFAIPLAEIALTTTLVGSLGGWWSELIVLDVGVSNVRLLRLELVYGLINWGLLCILLTVVAPLLSDGQR